LRWNGEKTTEARALLRPPAFWSRAAAAHARTLSSGQLQRGSGGGGRGRRARVVEAQKNCSAFQPRSRRTPALHDAAIAVSQMHGAARML